MSLQRGINFRSLAEKMGNCSGAEVRGICTEAGTFLSSLPAPRGSEKHEIVRDRKLIARNVRPKRKTSIRRTRRL